MELDLQYSSAEKALADLREAVQAGSKAKAGEQKKQIDDCERFAQRLKNALQSYRLEMRALPRDSQPQHLTRLKTLEDGLKQCRTQIDWKKFDAEASQPQASDAASAEDGPITLDQAVAVAEHTQKESRASLNRSLGMVLQAEQVGISTLGKMHEQEEQFDRIGEDMEDIKANLQRSKKLVSQIARSAANDRCIQVLCVSITICVLIAITLAITGKDNGQLTTLDPVRQSGT
mmetsp:Transcript_107137/g.190353  ORF Transcript_107137/g.190353 Transcript_107137/m.190353 type:complete len:232 (+) Transcript_107137:30-725(+)